MAKNAFDILSDILDMEEVTWTCRHCGYAQTSVISEVCDGCGIEDNEQGGEDVD